MAKLTKSQLKGIVKECLVEILVEGLDSRPTMSNSERLSALSDRIGSTPKRSASKPARSTQDYQRRPANDHVRFESAIKENVSNLTSNPMMADIFSDTARTTLQEQMANEVPTSTSAAQSAPGAMEQIGDPMEMFAASENWATLAFSDTKPKNS